MPDLPYALGCPSCSFFVEVSEEDADASLSELYDHIFSNHAGYDRARTNELLAKARELSETEQDPELAPAIARIRSKILLEG